MFIQLIPISQKAQIITATQQVLITCKYDAEERKQNSLNYEPHYFTEHTTSSW